MILIKSSTALSLSVSSGLDCPAYMGWLQSRDLFELKSLTVLELQAYVIYSNLETETKFVQR